MTVWTNNDGLRVKFGLDEAVKSQGGQISNTGATNVTEVTVEYTDIGSSAAVVDESTYLPAGAFIEKVELVVNTAFTSGGSATLNFGLIRTSDFSTAIDTDGLIAAGALATINAAGNIVEYTQGSTGHGALIGTTLANEGVFCVNYGTAAFTAGKATIRVHWSVPATVNS